MAAQRTAHRWVFARPAGVAARDMTELAFTLSFEEPDAPTMVALRPRLGV
jgi:hypothetical protein